MPQNRKLPSESGDGATVDQPTAPSAADTPEPATYDDTATVYTREDLMNAASAFGVTPDAMAGALRAAEIGDEGTTKAEAEKAVKAFQEREV